MAIEGVALTVRAGRRVRAVTVRYADDTAVIPVPEHVKKVCDVRDIMCCCSSSDDNCDKSVGMWIGAIADKAPR